MYVPDSSEIRFGSVARIINTVRVYLTGVVGLVCSILVAFSCCDTAVAAIL